MSFSIHENQLAGTPDTFQRSRRPNRRWDQTSLDQLAENQRHSTWPTFEKGLRGPEPYPSWLIEDAAAVDTTEGTIKTGKEGDVFLLERATATRSVLLAAKRYRSPENRQFTRSESYSEGRSVRRSRDDRAIKNSSTYGRKIAALQWASAEFGYLVRCHQAGIAVPYPVQIDGTEILMEFISDPQSPRIAAPRLHQLSRGDQRLPDLWEQAVGILEGFAAAGLAHGDLSAYNLLVAGERLVVIDIPQCVDLAGNVNGLDFLLRDCRNLCQWFASKGLERDPEALFTSLLAELFSA